MSLTPHRFEQIRTTLSPREVEVLQLVAHGKSNTEIARALGISDQTVKNHLTAIFQRLQVIDRTAAACKALREGIIE